MTGGAWTMVAILVGAAAGGLAGLVSARLPGGPPPRGGVALRIVGAAAAAVALAAWAAAVRPGSPAAAGALLGAGLLLLTLLDAEHFWLPDRVTLPLGALGLGVAASQGTEALIGSAVGTAAGFLLLWGAAFAYRRLRGREGLGGGDPRMLAAGGAWTGAAALPVVLLTAALLGLAAAAIAAVAGRRMTADTRLPFGCFLAAGIWLAWLYSPAVLSL